MPALAKRFHPGEVVGYATIIRLLFDAPAYELRSYLVRLACCGREVDLTQRQLKDAERRERNMCAQCFGHEVRLTPPSPRQTVAIGETIGPVTVLGAGATTTQKRVIWSCCGREDVMSHERLYRLRHAAKTQSHEAVCQFCYTAKRQGVPVVFDQPTRTDWRPTEILPPGILSAAVAWPRPRVGA